MVSSTLIEIIFKGVFSSSSLGFLSKLLSDAKDVRFNYPEFLSTMNSNNVMEVFHSNDYVDLVITTDSLEIGERIAKNVFINIGRDGEDVEVLIYFDIKDLNDFTKFNIKKSIDHLKVWSDLFSKKYCLDEFIAQMDNAGKDEFYFDSNGFGPLYEQVN